MVVDPASGLAYRRHVMSTRLSLIGLAILVLARAPVAVAQPLDVHAAGATVEAPSDATATTPDADEEAASSAEYAQALRGVVSMMRGKVEDKIVAKVQAKQAGAMSRIAMGLSLVACAGVLMFLAPLFLRRRYPGRGGVLWKYSAVSAGMFFLAVNLFAGVLMLMRGAQTLAGEHTNPQVQVVKATFDLFDAKAEDLALIGPTIIEPTLVSLEESSDKPVLSIMLDNLGALRQDAGVFSSVGEFFRKLDWAFGLLPILLALLAVGLFIQATRPTLTEIVKLPARAAEAGDARGLGKQVLGTTLRDVWRELKASGGMLGLLMVISAVAGVCLGFVLQPAIEVFLAYLALSFMYVESVQGASTFWILYSLGATILFLAVNLIVLVAATTLFLGKAQKVFQARFRRGIALSSHRRFWIWGTAALALLFVLPVVYIVAAEPALGWLVAETISETNWALNLGLGPSLFLVTFGLVFWAARGVKAIKFLATYKVAPRTTPAETEPSAPMVVAPAALAPSQLAPRPAHLVGAVPTVVPPLPASPRADATLAPPARAVSPTSAVRMPSIPSPPAFGSSRVTPPIPRQATRLARGTQGPAIAQPPPIPPRRSRTVAPPPPLDDFDESTQPEDTQRFDRT